MPTVYMFPREFASSLSARLLPLANALIKHGVECRVMYPINWGAIMGGLPSRFLSVTLTHSPRQYIDVLKNKAGIAIIDGISSPQILLLRQIYKLNGVRVVFDLSDALFLPMTKILGVSIRNPGYICLERLLKNADFVTANGHYLLRYAKMFNQRVALIRDPVSPFFFSKRSRTVSDRITIGWEGDGRVHYESLAILVKPLQRLARKYDLRFKIVSYLGNPKIKKLFERLEKIMEIDYGSDRWLPLKDFRELLSDFDIMAATLMKTPWYEGKSAGRAGIGMAMGIPIVASPVGEQKYIIRHGENGFLAGNEEEWYNYLKLLIEDDKLRKSMGRKNAQVAEKELSSDACGRKLYDIIESLY